MRETKMSFTIKSESLFPKNKPYSLKIRFKMNVKEKIVIHVHILIPAAFTTRLRV